VGAPSLTRPSNLAYSLNGLFGIAGQFSNCKLSADFIGFPAIGFLILGVISFLGNNSCNSGSVL